jgi:hypothetical protein
MRTTEDIITYYRNKQESDMFGFTGEVLLPYLSAEQVKPFLIPDADLSDWKQIPLKFESIVAAMREYMEFAWGKMQDHRGISASRSVEKMQAWLWLLGDEETLTFAQSSHNYAQYGAPVLKKICEKYGFPVPEGDDIERMAKGLACEPGCTGCGS